MNESGNNETTLTASLDQTGMNYVVSIIKGKYKIPIICCLMLHGPTRFNELKRQVKAATFTSLSKALKELEADGLLLRQEYYEIPPRVEYSLSDQGKALIPILQSLCAWSNQYGPQVKQAEKI